MNVEELQAKEASLNLDYLDAVIRATQIRARLQPTGSLMVRVGMGDKEAVEDLEGSRAELAEVEARADDLYGRRQAVRDEINLAERGAA